MIQRPRGTRDFTPSEMAKRRQVEASLRQTAELYNYREVSTPVFEFTELFTRKSGDEIVNQMYTFEDKGGRKISLRPELTAPTIRFYAEELHNLPKPIKLFYFGNCFRYERPQKGRFREFWQFGVELIDAGTPESEAEIVALAINSLKTTGLKGFKVRLGHLGILRTVLNDYGISDEQQIVLMPLIDKKDLQKLEDVMLTELDQPYDSVKELCNLIEININYDGTKTKTSSLILLDRSEELQKIVENHPNVNSYISVFDEVLKFLMLYGVHAFTVDLGVARGIDYYTDTVFEIDSPELGTEKQVCGGGVYSLYDMFDIKKVNSIGFAIGFDRLVMALDAQEYEFQAAVLKAYVIPVSDDTRVKGFEILTELRNNNIAVDIDLLRRNISKSLRYANSANVKYAIIVGEDELAQEAVTVRDMASGDQKLVKLNDLVKFLKLKSRI